MSSSLITDLPKGIVPAARRAGVSRLIGEIVVDLGLASREDVDAAVQEARAAGRSTGEALVARGTLTSDELARVLAERFSVDYVDLAVFAVDMNAAHLIAAEAARRYEAVPIGYLDERTLLLATADPGNIVAFDDITMKTGLDVRPVVASREDLAVLIAKITRLDDVAEAEAELEDDEVTALDLRDADDEAPIIKLVHAIIAEAIDLGASDIHFAPESDGMSVHYRIDGVLARSSGVPKAMIRGVVSRIKIMANLDISEKRVPQDGRLSLTVQGRPVDVRVVTLPLVSGESVVMRILDHGGGVIELDGLGLRDGEMEKLRHAVAQPYGAVLVTGPTGSGKTTTLYGALTELNSGQRSIITIEDPVEYRVEGIKQLQVNTKAGMHFASGLRSMMRADPDVIMVGEIRDRETAQIAVEAALTGHLVLSTLHTRDAPTALVRLDDMGIEPFLVASAVDCVIAQRLARKLCKECKREVLLTVEMLRAAGYEVTDDIPAFEAVGCGRCGKTGYRGRVGLYEVMVVNEEIRSLVMREASGDAITAAAIAAGMRPLRDDGLAKVRTGLTSLAEVARVAGS
jgi:type IV pilus assembly protein PilB